MSKVSHYNGHYIPISQLRIISFYRNDTTKWKTMENESKPQSSLWKKSKWNKVGSFLLSYESQ